MAANRRIKLRSTYGTTEEGRLSAIASPGMVVVQGSDGRYAPNATAGSVATPCKLVEEDSKIGRTVDNPFAVNELVQLYEPLPGDRANVLLATANNAAIGSGLARNAAGVYVVSATAAEIEFRATEALNNASGTNQLIACEKV